MRILIATPLYPPDTAETAHYVKELARRLSDQHEVTVVLYGHLPEEVENVRTISIDKRRPTLHRAFSFFWTLLREMTKHDILYVINGRSVEIPVFFALKLKNTPHLFLPFDSRARITTFGESLQQSSQKQISYENLSLTRPEILPFKAYPEKAFTKYESDWETHIKTLI